MNPISTTHNNGQQFEKLRTALASAAMAPEAFKRAIQTASATPQQLCRMVEVVLLSESTLEVKTQLLGAVQEYTREKLAAAANSSPSNSAAAHGTKPPSEVIVKVVPPATSTLEVKTEAPAAVQESTKQKLAAAANSSRPNSAAAQVTKSYEEARDLVAFFKGKLQMIVDLQEGKDGFTPSERQSILLAQLQDEVRLALRWRQIPVEDRITYEDPVATLLNRKREDFLQGAGVINPDALDI